MHYKVGDIVAWVSSANGSTLLKCGKITGFRQKADLGKQGIWKWLNE